MDAIELMEQHNCSTTNDLFSSMEHIDLVAVARVGEEEGGLFASTELLSLLMSVKFSQLDWNVLASQEACGVSLPCAGLPNVYHQQCK